MWRKLTLCYTVAMLTPMLLSTLALLVTLTGCSSMQEAGDGAEVKALTFQQVKTAPYSVRGQAAVFGGNVLTARLLKDGTRIEILQLPLDRSTRPGYDLTQSQGRFIAFQREFLDPATLPTGTRVTVTGEIANSITLPLDETDYTYPVINIKQLRVWNRSDDAVSRSRSPYYMGGPYWGGYSPLFWGPYGWPY
jgi:outer membrane lipoprotein